MNTLERKALYIMGKAEMENYAETEDKIYEQYRFPKSGALFEIIMDKETKEVLEIDFIP